MSSTYFIPPHLLAMFVNTQVLFAVAVTFAVVVFVLSAVELDSSHAKHLGAVMALFAFLYSVNFPFVIFALNCFPFGSAGCLSPLPFAWLGSWLFGNWYPSGMGWLVTLEMNTGVLATVTSGMLAAVLLKKSFISKDIPVVGPSRTHGVVAAAYALAVFLYMPSFASAVYSQLDGSTYTYGPDLVMGLVLPVLALPIYLFTMPAVPAKFAIKKLSRKSISGIVVASIVAAVTVPPGIFQVHASAFAVTSPYQISFPVIILVATTALVVGRRGALRTNKLFLIAFVLSALDTAILAILFPVDTVGEMFPLLLFTAFPILAIEFRHVQSKLWLAISLLLSCVGITQIIFFVTGVYELVLNVQAVPTLKTPRISPPASSGAGTLEEEEKRQ